MAIGCSPTIPLTGCCLLLDAGNVRSYPGSGTTWFDLSGNNNNGTLVNGVTWTSANGGYFICDGINDYIDVNTSQNLYSANHTVIGATRYAPGAGGIAAGRIINALTNNYLLGHHGVGCPRYYADGWIWQSSVTNVDGFSWNFHSGVGNYSSDIWTYYVNTALITSNSNGANGPLNFRLAHGGAERSNCYIACLYAWTRTLSAIEVETVVASIRGRYGL